MKLEILAPVGGMESLYAAVRAGADAVYFGAQDFNARRNADNFDDIGLKQAVAYCKTNGVCCYLTLNTLVKDDERAAAVQLAAKAYAYGIDGVILQDLGLARLLHMALPQLVLHGSTQLSIHSPAALPLLKELGFRRIVTAREMSEAELAAFCQEAAALGIEVEAFVHGALCMCLSGQCYFSAHLGGRSANRGLCAGTCRLPFSVKGGTGYDLSLKDLCLLPHLEKLSQMGITSFKIEGRMKRPEYVAAAVAAFRQAVDTGAVDPALRSLLEQVFSRGGFTDGYWTGRLGRGMFGVRSEEEKQLSVDAMAPIHDLYRWERQHIPLSLSIEIITGTPVSLTAESGNQRVTVSGPIPEPAHSRPLEETRVRDCLRKLGGTAYFAEEISCKLDAGLSLPISAINQLRKQAVSALEQRCCQPRPLPVIALPVDPPFRKRVLQGFFARFSNREQLLASVELLPDLIGYSLPAREWLAAMRSLSREDARQAAIKKAVAELPRGAADDSVTRALLAELKQAGAQVIFCGNLSAVQLTKEAGLTVMGGFGLNLFNSSALAAAAAIGLQDVIVSPELSGAELSRLSAQQGQRLFAICYGRQPLMLTRNCPVQNGGSCQKKGADCHLTDRKGQTFPVVCDNGFCEILNAKTTDLSDCLEFLSADYGCMCFTTESPEDTKKIIIAYRARSRLALSDFTRGLFRNGVL